MHTHCLVVCHPLHGRKAPFHIIRACTITSPSPMAPFPWGIKRSLLPLLATPTTPLLLVVQKQEEKEGAGDATPSPCSLSTTDAGPTWPWRARW